MLCTPEGAPLVVEKNPNRVVVEDLPWEYGATHNVKELSAGNAEEDLTAAEAALECDGLILIVIACGTAVEGVLTALVTNGPKGSHPDSMGNPSPACHIDCLGAPVYAIKASVDVETNTENTLVLTDYVTLEIPVATKINKLALLVEALVAAMSAKVTDVPVAIPQKNNNKNVPLLKKLWESAPWPTTPLALWE